MEHGSVNLLLQDLEPEIRRIFSDRFQRVEVSKSQTLQDPGQDIEWVWFPESGLISVVAENMSGESVSGSVVGWNGAVGVVEACGSRVGHATAVVQVPGIMLRMRAAACRELYDTSPAMRTAVHKYVEASLVETRQHAACNALHSVESRLIRMLLDIQERSRVGDRLPLTQESIAQLLGVQRTTVAVTISMLQKAGLLRTGRGVLEILSPQRLDGMACTCRRSIAFTQAEIYRSSFALCRAGDGSRK